MFWDAAGRFGQLLPRPHAADISAFYELDEYYTHGSTGAHEESNGLLHSLLLHLAWRADRGVAPDAGYWKKLVDDEKLRVLEIGCGNGSTLSLLKSWGHEVIGVEPDPRARAVATKAGVVVVDGVAEALPVAVGERTFDLVIISHVLEHCIDPVLAVRNALALVSPGGRIVAEVPNNACIGARAFGAGWLWLDIPRHLNFFTADSLSALFASQGGRVARIEFCGYARQFSHDWISAQSQIARTFGTNPPGMLRYWLLFLLSFWRNQSLKYDSVRLVVGRD